MRRYIIAAVVGIFLRGAAYGQDVPDPLDGLVEAQLIDEGGHIVQMEGETLVIKGMGGLRLDEILAETDGRIGSRVVSLPAMPGPAADKPSGPYLVGKTGKADILMPLREMTADVRIAGVIAHATVTQVFGNDGKVPIEALYVFPASTRAAVHAMRMRIGERTVEAQIEQKDKARQKYEKAKANGQAASLLEEQRRNVFTMSVANILPGAEIEVELEYSELLVPEDGEYELVFPTVVGPRYTGADEAEWAANPTLGEGEKEPYRFDITVEVESPIPIQSISSPSHVVKVKHIGKSRAKVGLVGTGGGTRDFVLRYSLADKSVETGVMLFEQDGGGHFVVMMEPPAKPKASQISPREYIFVLDVSGSMSGFPLDTAKALMRKLLSGLGKGDYFDVVVFAGASATLSDVPIEASTANVEDVIEAVESLSGGGGTELMQALETAFDIPPCGEEGISRTLVLVTDGYVSVEAQSFKLVRERLGDANLFTFGIGSSVNRALVEGLSRAGMGEPFVVLDPGAAEKEAKRFRSYVSSPVLTDVDVSFDGLAAVDVLPRPGAIPDLMARRPVVIVGRYEGEARGRITIEGKQGAKPYSRTFEVASADSGEGNLPLRWLWARRWADTLEDQLFLLPGDDDLEDAITLLGLDYSLLTSLTSFVAIDSRVLVDCGKLVTVKQPLPLPAGVSNFALGGGGGSGSGSGYGYGAGWLSGKGGSAPKLMVGASMVMGSLSKEAIASVVKQHRNEIRGCYQQSLLVDPDIEGRVVVRFVIDASTGGVVAVTIAESDLDAETLETCIESKVRTWTFPALHGGGMVAVNYPFLLEHSDDDGP
jgi:Ca-activated chloride channel family protein